MTKQEIERLKNFTLSEKDTSGRLIFAEYKAINPALMFRADWMVSYAKSEFGEGTVFNVIDINQGLHSKSGYHPRGEAIDGYFKGLSLYEQVLISLTSGMKGVGFYPSWRQPGIHNDIRDVEYVSMWYGYYVIITDSSGKKVRVQKYEYRRKIIFRELTV